ncbi:MAG: 30S ribosome-binding factor RbfA [Bacteroidota bacterium]
MATTIRQQQVASLLQQALGTIFLRRGSMLLGPAMVTVTEVQINSNLSLAKVYLSFMLHDNPAAVLKNIEQRKRELRKLLGDQIGKKLRKVPYLQFHIDDSAEKAKHINRLLNTLDLPPDVAAPSKVMQ